MTTKTSRKIVHIDHDKCDGCGLCVPNCAEGAIRLVNGKAKLVADNLCDGLGACLGHCPKDAIRIEERPADDFDHHAVQHHLRQQHAPNFSPIPPQTSTPHPQHSCPGSRLRMLQPSHPLTPQHQHPTNHSPSRLGQWPVQLALLPTSGPIWQDAHLLIAADCAPFAFPDFHQQLLAGKTLAIACPKLDNVEPYLQKLVAIFSNNSIKSVTVAHMEVPCCSGLVRLVHAALQQSGQTNIPLHNITITIDGNLSTTT